MSSETLLVARSGTVGTWSSLSFAARGCEAEGLRAPLVCASEWPCGDCRREGALAAFRRPATTPTVWHTHDRDVQPLADDDPVGGYPPSVVAVSMRALPSPLPSMPCHTSGKARGASQNRCGHVAP